MSSIKTLIVKVHGMKRRLAAARVPVVVVTGVFADDSPEAIEAKAEASKLKALAEAGLKEWPSGVEPIEIIVKTYGGETATGEPPPNGTESE